MVRLQDSLLAHVETLRMFHCDIRCAVVPNALRSRHNEVRLPLVIARTLIMNDTLFHCPLQLDCGIAVPELPSLRKVLQCDFAVKFN